MSKIKYSVKAFSFTYPNGGNSIMLLFKGAFYFRIAGQKGKFVFPWQGKKIELTDSTKFPIVFIGIRGKRVFTYHEIAKSPQWSPKNNWTEITNCELANVNPDSFINTITLDSQINQIKEDIKINQVDFTNLEEPDVPIPLVDLSSYQQYSIPSHIYQLKKILYND
jgi:hypothetical protein